MSNSNRYIVQQANVMSSPIAFTSTTGSANVAAALTTTRANCDKLLDELAKEGVDGTTPRYFLDEMSPVARITLYRIILDLKAASVV